MKEIILIMTVVSSQKKLIACSKKATTAVPHYKLPLDWDENSLIPEIYQTNYFLSVNTSEN